MKKLHMLWNSKRETRDRDAEEEQKDDWKEAPVSSQVAKWSSEGEADGSFIEDSWRSRNVMDWDVDPAHQ